MNLEKFIVIAIDGGAASGKSTTSSSLAEKLNLLHVDTGSHYRLITSEALKQNLLPEDLPSIIKFLEKLQLGTQVDGKSAQITVNNAVQNPAELRSPAVNEMVSKFAAIPEIRNVLLAYQRDQEKVARDNHFGGLIMEGRDIGSVVLPHAPYRFFLHADPATRQNRRQAQGEIDSISTRDKEDSTRKTAPLTCPEGAVLVDTSKLSIEEVVQYIFNYIATS